MSGIAGVAEFSASADEGEVRAMTAAMPYRGGGCFSFWEKNNCVLAQASTRNGANTIARRRRRVLVMDGRIDNASEVRAHLAIDPHDCPNASDSELVLRAYEVWGAEALLRLDGDFAFAVWDEQDESLFCARDRFGHRPFFYWHTDSKLAFASDFHAVLCARGAPHRVNEAMAAEHLCLYGRNLDETLVTGVMRLPPAHWLEWKRGQLRSGRYWSVERRVAEPLHDDDEAVVEEFRSLLFDAVRRCTNGAGNVGIYLSGGLDSSSIACSALRPDMATGRVTSYSLAFPEIHEADEAPHIATVRAHCGIRGRTVDYRPTPFDEFVERIARFQDPSEAPNGAMLDPLRALARDDGARVLLTGSGGDEWFARNPYYLAELVRTSDWAEVAAELRRSRNAGHGLGQVLKQLLQRGFGPFLPEPVRRHVRTFSKWRRSVRGGGSGEAQSFLCGEVFDRLNVQHRLGPPPPPAGSTRSVAYLHSLLHFGLIVRSRESDSRALSVIGVEERHPFYDRRLVEFAFALPERLRSQGPGKFVLREAMRGVLPEPIRTREGKADFSRVIVDTLLDPAVEPWLRFRGLASAGLADPNEIAAAYRRLQDLCERRDPAFRALSWKIWAALTLEVWLTHRM